MAPKLGVQWPANTTSIHPVSHARLTQTAEALDWLWLNTRTDYGFCPLSFGQHSEGIDSQPLCKRVKTIANNNFKRTYGICCTEIDYLLFNTTDFHCHVQVSLCFWLLVFLLSFLCDQIDTCCQLSFVLSLSIHPPLFQWEFTLVRHSTCVVNSVLKMWLNVICYPLFLLR